MPVLPPGTYVWGIRWFRKLVVGDTIIFLHEGKEKIKRIADMRSADLFVVGDHADASTDSRHFGWIPKDSVVAKIIWPHAPRR